MASCQRCLTMQPQPESGRCKVCGAEMPVFDPVTGKITYVDTISLLPETGGTNLVVVAPGTNDQIKLFDGKPDDPVQLEPVAVVPERP